MRPSCFKYTAITFLTALFLTGGNIVAQETTVENYKMSFALTTLKSYDNSREFEVKFEGKNKKDRKDKIPIYDAEIKFFNTLNDTLVLLGKAKTNKEGISEIIVPEGYNYLIDELGFINIKAVFEGGENMDDEEDEVSVKDLILELDLQEIDSVKTVLVNAFAIDSLGTKSPVVETDVIISVGGMLSKMRVEEGYIENGHFEYEFPDDIPGDVNGDITVYAMIEDHDEFANVIQKKTINWGTFNTLVVKKRNTLWSEAAPIWMYIVLTILLAGVWINYGYSIFNLFKIRKEGRDLNTKSLENKKG